MPLYCTVLCLDSYATQDVWLLDVYPNMPQIFFVEITQYTKTFEECTAKPSLSQRWKIDFTVKGKQNSITDLMTARAPLDRG